jgi:hypothetical protein
MGLTRSLLKVTKWNNLKKMQVIIAFLCLSASIGMTCISLEHLPLTLGSSAVTVIETICAIR